MTHPPPARTDARRVLLSVTNAREVVRAGCGGARLSVRTLDQISCHVHAGELLTLRGSVASGALSLLRALHGTSHRIRAEHHAAPQVQLRRATVSAIAAVGIENGWREQPRAEHLSMSTDIATHRESDAGLTAMHGTRAPVVYLLRVRAQSPREVSLIELSGGPSVSAIEQSVRAWHAWAQQVRDAGGAIVLAVQTPISAIAQIQTRPTHRGARLVAAAVRERVSGSADNIRTLTLHAGQIISAGAGETLPC